MRRLLPLLLTLCLLPACDEGTRPRVLSLAGTWETTDLPGARIQFTAVEGVRAINGAGHLLTPDSVLAFRVEGATQDELISVLFDFDHRADLNFFGRFAAEEGDELVLVGALFGGTYRGTPVTFAPVVGLPDR